MTYAAFEGSTESSRPLELFEFILGGEAFRYCTSERARTVVSTVYTPESVKRGRMEQGANYQDHTLEVTLPATNDFARRYITSIPGEMALFTLRRLQLGDGATPEVITLFQGVVQSVVFTEDARLAKVYIVPATTAATREIPRFSYMGSCNHFLYDSGCKISAANPAYKYAAAVVTAASGSTITVAGVSGFAAGWFDAGFVEVVGGTDARMVISATGDVLTILMPFPFDIVGQTVNVRAGCKKDIATCKAKFNNVINFGGFAFVPTRNPFDSGLI